MAISFPWDDEASAAAPQQYADPDPKPRGRRPWLDPGLAPSSPAAASGTEWLYHHLTITGPAEAVAAFAAAARGAGVTPWRLDFSVLEEDIFNLAASQPSARRNLTIAGCRILARQFRERVERRQGRAATLVGQGQGCRFDLHALLPGYGFFTGGNGSGGETPTVAIATLRTRWPSLRLRLQKRPLD